MARKYKKQKDGRFQTKVWDGTYTKDNLKHYITLYSDKSSADLERTVSEYKKMRDEGKVKVSSGILFVDYSREWLKTYKKVRERGTQIMYENIIEKHFSYLSSLKLTDLSRMHFQLLINDALEYPRTCQQIKITLCQVVESAISDKLLPADSLESICRGIDMPKYVPAEKRGLTPLEKEAIKTADFTDREKAFVYIAYGCGLRRGEILALTIFDISIERSELTVNKSLAFEGNNPYLKRTKTVNGERTVPVPPFLLEFLGRYIKSLSGTNLFQTKTGGLMTASAYRKMWESILKKMNAAAGGTELNKKITGLTAHMFRHNYCANLCYQMPNISIKRISQLLGDTEKMVLEVYNHILEEKENVKEVVADAIAL